MMRFKKQRCIFNESTDRFLDDLENLSRSKDPEESKYKSNFSIASKLIDGLRSDGQRTTLPTFYTFSENSALIPEQTRQTTRENELLKLKKYSTHS